MVNQCGKSLKQLTLPNELDTFAAALPLALRVVAKGKVFRLSAMMIKTRLVISVSLNITTLRVE